MKPSKFENGYSIESHTLVDNDVLRSVHTIRGVLWLFMNCFYPVLYNMINCHCVPITTITKVTLKHMS